MGLINLLNSRLSWHDKEKWDSAVHLIEQFFIDRPGDVAPVMEKAVTARGLIDGIDSFMQQSTAEVCPHCEKVCCMNRHGYYDYEDVIYIHALGLKPPAYNKDIHDTAPCQFISEYGCTIERSLRPNRCNWFFCNTLISHMENGHAKSYREFLDSYNDAIEKRKEMLDGFFKVLSGRGELVNR